MKRITLTQKIENQKLAMLLFVFLVATFSNFVQAQNYRTIDAYLDDFGKNEMFVKKALIDYSVTIIESQLDERSKITSGRIVDKLANINKIMKSTNQGFEGNTLLRDSFMQMNEKTMESLKNGSLILTDYDYQSALSFDEINANMAQKEKDMINYYEEVKNFDAKKRLFGSQYNVGFKATGKNVLEYNAKENLLFYKMNVIDQKLGNMINTKDKAGFAKCFAVIETMKQEVIAKTNQYKDLFKDTSLNDANVKYANFIYSQKAILNDLFNAYADESAKLAVLKKSTEPQTAALTAAYNQQVQAYNARKNAFYAVFDKIQATKKAMYDNWFVINSRFLQNNSEIDNIHERYTLPDSNIATR